MTDTRLRRRTFLKFALAGTSALLAPALLLARRSGVSAAPDNLDALLEPIRASHGVPALAGAFVRGSALVAVGAVGVRVMGMPERVQPTDRFHLGSCTKSMTATLLAMLVEQGKPTWETTIADVWPDLRNTMHAAYRPVTLLQLLSHRSGLPMGVGRDSPILPQVVTALSSGPLPRQRRRLLELVLTQPPVSAPGSRYLYSNLGYLIAGAVAEQVTGLAWEDLLRESVFAPLGMATAGFGLPGLSQPWGHTAERCQPVPPGPDADNPLAIGPAGTVHSSLGDWSRFVSLHLRGARGEEGLLLKPESFRQLHRDHFQQEYALGWIVTQRPWAGGAALTHAGSNGFWYAFVWIAPARNAAFLAATNCGSESGARACDASIGEMIRKYL